MKRNRLNAYPLQRTKWQQADKSTKPGLPTPDWKKKQTCSVVGTEARGFTTPSNKRRNADPKVCNKINAVIVNDRANGRKPQFPANEFFPGSQSLASGKCG
jgi:hypothetical protein